MNKFLLCTTALMTAGFLAAGANASDLGSANSQPTVAGPVQFGDDGDWCYGGSPRLDDGVTVQLGDDEDWCYTGSPKLVEGVTF